MSFGLNASFLLPQIQSMLLSVSNDQMAIAIIPIIICLAGIHLIFRNFFTITWFSFKIVLSLLVYVQIRDVVSSYISSNVESFEYKTFGIPTGTIEMTANLGLQIVKSHVLSTISSICPTCFVGFNAHQEPEVPVEPLQEENPTVTFSWVEWISDLITM